MRSKILVSACLMGFNVRYNGTKKGHYSKRWPTYSRNSVWLSIARSWRQGSRFHVHPQKYAMATARM